MTCNHNEDQFRLPANENRGQGETHEINLARLKEVYAGLNTASGRRLDMVAIGCPHFSLEGFARLAKLVEGKKCHPGTRFLVATNRANAQKAEEAGFWEQISAFGAQLVFDTCILTMPAMLASDIETIMTNSGKYAYYTPGLLERTIHFADMETCVRSAVAGQIIEERTIWQI